MSYSVRTSFASTVVPQATKPKPAPKKKPAKKSVLEPLAAPGAKLKLEDGTVGVVGKDGKVRDVVTGDFIGCSIAGTRPAKRIYKSSFRAKKLGAVIDIKEFRLNTKKPTLNDMAAYLRPGEMSVISQDIFQGGRIKPLAGEDGVKWWGWNVQNKRPGVKKEDEWVFV